MEAVSQCSYYVSLSTGGKMFFYTTTLPKCCDLSKQSDTEKKRSVVKSVKIKVSVVANIWLSKPLKHTKP